MPNQQEQQNITANSLDQDQSRAALATITYLMTHTLPPARMQSQAQPNEQVQQQEQQTEQKPKEDKTAELKGQMEAMKTENDAKIKSIIESQQKEIDQLKQMIQQILDEDKNEAPNPSQTPTSPQLA